MIPTMVGKYLDNQIGAPRVITSTAQLEEYVCALIELDQQSRLTSAERNFAELLIVLIEAYVEKPISRRLASPVEVLEGLLSKDLLQKN